MVEAYMFSHLLLDEVSICAAGKGSLALFFVAPLLLLISVLSASPNILSPATKPISEEEPFVRAPPPAGAVPVALTKRELLLLPPPKLSSKDDDVEVNVRVMVRAKVKVRVRLGAQYH
jgi:hypothetical protein